MNSIRIAHIADIHWRGLTRHAEYTKAFARLFQKLKAARPDAIFIGGDLFHTKTSGISPEVIDRIAWMLRELADIAMLHITLGNHDGNLANEDRQDAISPIVNAMDHDNIRIYKKSTTEEIWSSPSITLCVYSCFDKDGWSKVAPVEGSINIAAFHGSVGGTKMDNAWVMPDSKAEVKIDMFDGYDFVLLGDIHKRQFLAERPDDTGIMKPYIAYPGSTIQQSFGEEEDKGFLLWDIRAKDDWDVQFVEVENYQPFLTVPWADSVQGTLEALESNRKLLPGSRYRIVSEFPLSPLVGRQLVHELESVRKAQDVVIHYNKALSYDTIDAGGVTVKKSSLRNNKDAIHGLYKEFLDANTKKHALSNDQIEEGKIVIDDYLYKLNSTELETARDVVWTIKSFEFDNLYCYGENNKIEFEGLDGIVGIFGKNKLGKSSIIGALMYALFNTSDRPGVTKNGQIMNQNKKTCSAKAVVVVNGDEYLIERSSVRAEAPKKGKALASHDFDKTENKINFSRLHPDGTIESLNGITGPETDKAIRKLLGNAEDFMMTSVATQTKMEKFIDEGPTARKSILNRFMDLEIFEKLFAFAKEDVALLNAKTADYSMGWEEAIKAHELGISTKMQEVQDLEGKIQETRTKLDGLRLWISQNESADAIAATEALIQVQREIFRASKLILTDTQSVESAKASIITQNTRLNDVKKELAVIDIDGLQVLMTEMEALSKSSRALNESKNTQEMILQTQEKSVRKLTLVPCGDSFPTCMYIKDSHEDKRKIETQKATVKKVARELGVLMDSLKTHQNKGYDITMVRYHKLTKDLLAGEKDNERLGMQIKQCEDNIKENNLRLEHYRGKETSLKDKLSQFDDTALEEAKRNLKETQNVAFGEDRKKNELLIQIGRDQAALEKIQTDKVECDKLLARLRVLESVQAGFHKNGIPAIVLKAQLPAVNAEIARFLGGLVDFDITFETEAGSNVMDVFIEDQNPKRILELGSGMEKMIASMAIRVALIRLSSLPKPDFWIIDEGFNALDEVHVPKCLSLLQTMKNYFRSVFVISHMQLVKEATDIIVEVVGTPTGSKVEV